MFNTSYSFNEINKYNYLSKVKIEYKKPNTSMSKKNNEELENITKEHLDIFKQIKNKK